LGRGRFEVRTARHNHRVAPRRSRRHRTRHSDAGKRPFNIRTHWRADGKAKTAYPTQRDAADAADERRRESGSELTVYQCDFCSAWHMGTVSARDE
jgi:hypothetical protein